MRINVRIHIPSSDVEIDTLLWRMSSRKTRNSPFSWTTIHSYCVLVLSSRKPPCVLLSLVAPAACGCSLQPRSRDASCQRWRRLVLPIPSLDVPPPLSYFLLALPVCPDRGRLTIMMMIHLHRLCQHSRVYINLPGRVLVTIRGWPVGDQATQIHLRPAGLFDKRRRSIAITHIDPLAFLS